MLFPNLVSRSRHVAHTRSRRSVCCASWIAAGLSFVATASLIAQPTFTNLGTLPGGGNSYALAVSGDGSTVCGYGSVPGSSTRAFRWMRVGGMQDLGALPGTDSSIAHAINFDGTVIVGQGIGCAAPLGCRDHAVRWTLGSGPQDLGTLPSGAVSYGYGVTADGSIAVGGSTIQSGITRPCRWTAPGAAEEVGTFQDNDDGAARVISADGSIIAGWATTSGYPHATLWTGSGALDLGTIAGFPTSFSNAMTPDGAKIVGTCRQQGVSARAFRWTASRGMENLGALPTHGSSDAFGVSADGAIVVGSAARSIINGDDRAVLWTPALGMVDLNIYFPSLGLSLDGNRLTHATGISADGTVIIGWGTGGAWRAEIPRPCTCVADRTCDGNVASDDFFDFLDDFFVQAPSSDVTYDGFVNTQDFFHFIAAFFAGC